MIDVVRSLFATAGSDISLQTLLGGSGPSGDTRIYQFYEGDAVLRLDLPSYITASALSEPENTQAVETMIFGLTVVARAPETVEAVEARLRVLFHQVSRATDASRTVFWKVVNAVQFFNVPADFTGKTVQIRASWSAV